MSNASVIKRIRKVGEQVLPQGGSLWLYGSRARGDYRPDSDWDLLVLIPKDKLEFEDYDKFTYPLTELGWELDKPINPILYTKQEWERYNFTPFYHNVEHDKVVLV